MNELEQLQEALDELVLEGVLIASMGDGATYYFSRENFEDACRSDS